jgi:hypothetical protein
MDIIQRPVFYLKQLYRFIRIYITIAIMDIIQRPGFYLKLNSIGLSVFI